MSAIPFPPQYHKGGHHSITLRAELIWQRAVVLGLLSAALLGLTTLFDTIPEYIDDALTFNNIPENIDQLVAYGGSTAHFQSAALVDLRDIEASQTKLLLHSKAISAKLTAIEVETGAIDATSTAMAATQLLMWQQMTNLLTMTGDANALLQNILEQVTYSEDTFRKRVRNALKATTIIGTTAYEAGGECDLLPTECALDGETEMIVEDVTWL